MKTSKCRRTNIFVFLWGENAVSQKKPIMLLRSNHDRTDLVPNTSIFNTLCCRQLQFWFINPKCIQLDKDLYLYIPNPNKNKILNFVTENLIVTIYIILPKMLSLLNQVSEITMHENLLSNCASKNSSKCSFLITLEEEIFARV